MSEAFDWTAIDKDIRALGGKNPAAAVERLSRKGQPALFRVLDVRRSKVDIGFPEIGGRDREEFLVWAVYAITAAHPEAAEQAVLQGYADVVAFLSMRAALGGQGVALLLAGLRSRQADVRFHAACGFAEKGGHEAASALLKLVSDRSAKVRQVAVETVAVHGDEQSVPFLRKALASSANLKYRSLLDAAAAGILRLTGETVEIPELPAPPQEPTPEPKPRLSGHLPPPPADGTLDKIDALIIDLGDFDLVNEVSNKLADFGPAALYRVLGVLDGSTPVSPQGHWRDTYEGLGTALHALAAACPEEYLQVAGTDTDLGGSWLEQSLYVSGLGAIEDYRAVPILLSATRSKDEWSRHNAARALSWRDEESLLYHFEKLLEDQDPSMRSTAVDGLSRIGGERELEIIQKEVEKKRNSDYPIIRQFMQNAIDDMTARLAKNADGKSK